MVTKAPAEKLPASSDMSHDPDSELVRILLVDDSEDDAVIAQAMLASLPGMDFQVDWAFSFDAGLNLLKQNTHDICLLDFCLGNFNGLDLFQEALRYGCRIPVIMLTGTTDRQIDLKAIKMGAADYLVKGEINSGILERVIRHARERARAERERAYLTQQLIERSRLAGMGEVAANVLHNVGNILTSINTSAGVVSEQLQHLPIHDVQRVARLLATEGDDLATYLSSDKKGQRVPAFLDQLSLHLIHTVGSAKTEMEKLVSQVHNIKSIIAAQQEFTDVHDVLEPIILQELVECALLLHQSGFEKHHIEVTREYADLPQVIGDKHQLFQILNSLFCHAQEAMRTTPVDCRQLTVSLEQCPDQEHFARIRVRDTGAGLHPDHFTRLFAQNYESPNIGYGRLHESALAAKNLGGELTVWSEGEGCGATFTLLFPMHMSASNGVQDRQDLQVHM